MGLADGGFSDKAFFSFANRRVSLALSRAVGSGRLYESSFFSLESDMKNVFTRPNESFDNLLYYSSV